MDDLISRAAAIEAALDGADEWDGGYNPTREEYIREHMAKVPAVDAAPVVHGHWVDHSAYKDGTVCRECSECHDIQIYYNTYYPNYCLNCGAKMDGGATHEPSTGD